MYNVDFGKGFAFLLWCPFWEAFIFAISICLLLLSCHTPSPPLPPSSSSSSPLGVIDIFFSYFQSLCSSSSCPLSFLPLILLISFHFHFKPLFALLFLLLFLLTLSKPPPPPPSSLTLHLPSTHPPLVSFFWFRSSAHIFNPHHPAPVPLSLFLSLSLFPPSVSSSSSFLTSALAPPLRETRKGRGNNTHPPWMSHAKPSPPWVNGQIQTWPSPASQKFWFWLKKREGITDTERKKHTDWEKFEQLTSTLNWKEVKQLLHDFISLVFLSIIRVKTIFLFSMHALLPHVYLWVRINAV